MTTDDPIRMPATREGGRVQQLGLAHLFVTGSKSHRVAERLLDGNPYTRTELSRAEGLAPSSVTRVVDTLQAAGIRVDRERSDTRDAVYRASVPDVVDAPAGSWTFVAPREEGPLMHLDRMELLQAESGQLQITLTGPLGKVRGTSTMTTAVTDLTLRGLPLTRVVLLAGGQQDWVLGSAADPVVLREVAWIE